MQKNISLQIVMPIAVLFSLLAILQTASAQTVVLDKPIKDFTLREMRTGKPLSLYSFKGKKRAIVLVFMANRCGMTWSYAKQIRDLEKDAASHNCQILIIHSDYIETDKELKETLAQQKITAPILDDKPKQQLVHYLGAETTPTFYILDSNMVLRYEGGYDRGHLENTARFIPAWDAVLAGKPVILKKTAALGCGITFRPAK